MHVLRALWWRTKQVLALKRVLVMKGTDYCWREMVAYLDKLLFIYLTNINYTLILPALLFCTHLERNKFDFNNAFNVQVPHTQSLKTACSWTTLTPGYQVTDAMWENYTFERNKTNLINFKTLFSKITGRHVTWEAYPWEAWWHDRADMILQGADNTCSGKFMKFIRTAT